MMSALRRGLGIAVLRCALVPMERKKLDEDRLHKPLIRDPDSPIDRVLMIFDRDANGTISPELSLINVAGFTGMLVGAIAGGITKTHLAIDRFKQSNEVTLFFSHGDAKRKLRDSSFLNFYRGAAIGGFRHGIFCLSFIGISTIASRFRGKEGVAEWSLGGLLSGALYKFSLGPKGMISGGFFGCLLGTICGWSMYAAAKLTNSSMRDIYQETHSYFRAKDSFFHSVYKPQLEHPDIIIDTYYPDGMGSMSNTLDVLEDLTDERELKFNKQNIDISKTENVNSNVNVKNQKVEANKHAN